MVHLTQLPPEILHNILSHVEPEDTVYVRQTCRYLLTFIDGNRALFRDLYYRNLDDPPPDDADLDWEREIMDCVRLRAVCMGKGLDKKSELPFVYKTTTRLLSRSARSLERPTRSVTHASSRNASLLAEFFAEEANRSAFLSRSFIFERARGETKNFADPPKAEHQMSAHLHCLYGNPLLKHGRTRSSRMYPFACSKVYDLREYTRNTHWGPFRNDGSLRADWEKVEAILLVLRSNIKNKRLDSFSIFAHFWDTPFAGPWEGSYVPWPPAAEREQSELERRDPYDVSGTWLRVVCFLDYNDFFAYNFPIGDELPDNVPRPALDTVEATRLILMKIHVTNITDPEEGDGDGPVVHFKGFSRSLDSSWDDNADSDLRGTARMTPEGEVRWTTYSIFSGQERWKSEGIQIGGRRSAKGVVGNWFEKDYDPHGPCGPTAFWKISDRELRGDDHQVELNDFLPIVDGYEHEFEFEDQEHEHDIEEDNDDHEHTDDSIDDGEDDAEVYLPIEIEYIEIDS